MTAKRKGKVMMVKTAGLASRYAATPYASMSSWKAEVNLFVLKKVGGDSLVVIWLRIGATVDPDFSVPLLGKNQN